MIRYECYEWLARLLTDQLVITSLSGQRVEWGHLSKRDADLNLGSMGNALAVGIGLALALPHRKVLVFESDGSVLLSLFNLPTLANLDPRNLVVFVFDNQAYSGTRISYPSATAGKTDLAAVARASGIEHAVTVSQLEDQESSKRRVERVRPALCSLQSRRKPWPPKAFTKQCRFTRDKIPVRPLSRAHRGQSDFPGAWMTASPGRCRMISLCPLERTDSVAMRTTRICHLEQKREILQFSGHYKERFLAFGSK
jgi:thiamine pyrophosphate-dependent enzyme